MTGVLQRVADEQAPPPNPATRWAHGLLWFVVGGLYVYDLYVERDRLSTIIPTLLLSATALMAGTLVWGYCIDRLCRWIAGDAWRVAKTTPPPTPRQRRQRFLRAFGWFALASLQAALFGRLDHGVMIAITVFGLLTAVAIGWAVAARLGLVDRPPLGRPKPLNLSGG